MNIRIKSLTYLRTYQHKCCAATLWKFLPVVIGLLSEWLGYLKNLNISLRNISIFDEPLELILVIQYKLLHCAADKTADKKNLQLSYK